MSRISSSRSQTVLACYVQDTAATENEETRGKKDQTVQSIVRILFERNIGYV